MGSEIIIAPAAFLLAAYVIFTLVDGVVRWRRLRLTTDFQGKLLERIGSAREFGEFLNTEGGGRFLDVMSAEKGGSAYTRILRAVQTGIVMTILGAALFIFVNTVSLPEFVPENLAFVATVSTAIGLGLLISSFVSYRLSRKMGLIDEQSRRSPGMTTAA